MEPFDGAHDFLDKLQIGKVITRGKRWRLAAQRLLVNRRRYY
jgi:hypothetical protein